MNFDNSEDIEYKNNFINRLIGIPPLNDEISRLKFKLKKIKILSIIITLIIVVMFFTLNGFYSRETIISTEYQPEQKLPQCAFIFMQGNASNINFFNIKKYKGLQLVEDLLTLRYNGSNVYNVDRSLPNEGRHCAAAIILDNYLAFSVLDDCISLKEGEQLYVTFININSSIIELGLHIHNNFQSLTNGAITMNKISKNIFSDQHGNKIITYKNSVTMNQPIIYYNSPNYTQMDQLNKFGFSFSSSFILIESVQTNIQILIGVLSNVGSSITVIILVFEIIFMQITKLLIQDKSAWMDDDVRNCIIYHYNQIDLYSKDEIGDDIEDQEYNNNNNNNSNSNIIYSIHEDDDDDNDDDNIQLIKK